MSAPEPDSTSATGDRTLVAAPFDLSAILDHDVVANPDDAVDDAFDEKNDYRLVVTGYDGRRTDHPQVHGLPVDGRVGVHRLGSFDGPNALGISAGRAGEVIVDVPRDRYLCVRFLVSGANGDSIVPVVFEYATGEPRAARVACEDWFDDPIEGDVAPRSPATAVWNGMDRMGSRSVEVRRDASLFEVLLAADPERELVRLRFVPESARFSAPEARCWLFAATGIRREASGE